jgi:phospholipid/cholesterol/gamma-HCH transport system substrate-binding protein
MQFRIRFANQIVGAFILLALAATVALFIALGVNQRWFARNYAYRSTFATANGISSGMPISYRGFQIGKVTDIRLRDRTEVAVEFYIEDRYQSLVTEHSVLEVAANPLGLGGGMLFHPGLRRTDPLEEGALVPSLSSPEGRRLVEAGLVSMPEQQDQIAALLSSAAPAIRNLDSLLVSLTDTSETVGAALRGEGSGPVAEIVEQANAALAQTNTLLAQAQQLTVEAQTISENVAQASASFADPTGLVPKLLEGEGSVSTLLNDDNALYDRIEGLLQRLDTTVGELEEAVRFVNESSPQIRTLLSETQDALDSGQKVLEGVRNNPLIRRGIPSDPAPPAAIRSYRDPLF